MAVPARAVALSDDEKAVVAALTPARRVPTVYGADGARLPPDLVRELASRPHVRVAVLRSMGDDLDLRMQPAALAYLDGVLSDGGSTAAAKLRAAELILMAADKRAARREAREVASAAASDRAPDKLASEDLHAILAKVEDELAARAIVVNAQPLGDTASQLVDLLD